LRIELQPRLARSLAVDIAAVVGALAVAMVLGGIAVAALGKSPAQAFWVYFVAPLTEGWSLQALAVKAAPLVLIAVGLIFCFRANIWNIGAEGQFVMGGAAGGWIALLTHDGAGQGLFGALWILPAMLIAGAVAGALYAMIPALLRVWLGVSEILTSLMLVYVAQYFLDYMVRGPWRDPQGFNFPVSVDFDDAALLPSLVPGGRLHAGVLIALVAALIAAFVLARTVFGFAVRTEGAAPRAARFAGFHERRLIIGVLAISGACAGLAGICEVSGQIGQLQPAISPGYGFTAIIVAFLGRLSPIGAVAAGLVLALAHIGGEAAQVSMRLPFFLTGAFQGALLMCVLGADFFTRYRVALRPEKTA
jgi:ABC-type uncharacterized transport system permease subunit